MGCQEEDGEVYRTGTKKVVEISPENPADTVVTLRGDWNYDRVDQEVLSGCVAEIDSTCERVSVSYTKKYADTVIYVYKPCPKCEGGN